MRVILSLFTVIFLGFSCTNQNGTEEVKLEGNALGTTFHITYYDVQKRDFSHAIDSLLHKVNKSLSTYIATSDISKINKGDTSIVVGDYFKEVFDKSAVIYKSTDGSFDPTIGSLVNAWGFGPQKTMTSLNKNQIDSLLQYVGFNKVQLKNHRIVKADKNIYLDFNAIAKGYAIDLIGRYFESQQISKYLVEMGGEIRARGDKEWHIAIEHPNFDGSQSFQATVILQNESIATSGSYRKFKLNASGQKYIHIINPKTGKATMSNLLSTSVIAPTDCADVDGYATAFMVMGLEKTKTFLNSHKKFKAFLIYSQEDTIKTYKTENLALQR
ncbi:MAG: FAD:protein FMN transferase [Flavobacteriaceae bacterium]|nr:FAD:protein FMN transferase [Flavobacteriaceae bacterium]